MKSSWNDIVNGDQPVLVDFFATWCGPCKAMAPILFDVKSQMGDEIRIVKIDVDQNPEIAARYQVRGVPTLMLFKAGEILWNQFGVVPANQLVSALRAAL